MVVKMTQKRFTYEHVGKYKDVQREEKRTRGSSCDKKKNKNKKINKHKKINKNKNKIKIKNEEYKNQT